MSRTASYDFLLVGAGLFNAVFANEAAKEGKKCLVVEKRKHLGGNLYSVIVNGGDSTSSYPIIRIYASTCNESFIANH